MLHDDPSAIVDDNGVVACYDDPKGASDDGHGAIGEGKLPNYESCSTIKSVNDGAT